MPILSKVYQKNFFVKLKSVRKLLKIACVADRKFIQILLKIVPNLTFTGHPRSKVIQFKDHEVN